MGELIAQLTSNTNKHNFAGEIFVMNPAQLANIFIRSKTVKKQLNFAIFCRIKRQANY